MKTTISIEKSTLKHIKFQAKFYENTDDTVRRLMGLPETLDGKRRKKEKRSSKSRNKWGLSEMSTGQVISFAVEKGMDTHQFLSMAASVSGDARRLQQSTGKVYNVSFTAKEITVERTQ